MKDCRNCQKWETCPCGESGHRKGTSIGYSIGECEEYEEKRMTKREAYKRVFGKEAIHIEGIDWDSEVDDTFEMELEVIKQMVEGMQNESNISN